jgi:hypothetical protein
LPPEIPDILSRIVARKHEELRETVSTPAELAEAAGNFERRDFAAALRSKTSRDHSGNQEEPPPAEGS